MANTEDKRVVSMAKVKAEKTVAFNRATYGEVIRSNRVKMGLSQPQLASILDKLGAELEKYRPKRHCKHAGETETVQA